MKRIVPVFIFVLLCICSNGQNSETKNKLTEIEGKWAVDDNGNVTYQRIVEVPEMKRDDIYNRVLNYFIYNYGSGKSVIQTQDKENGQIIGKGLYENLRTFSNGMGFVNLSTWHIVRVDVKDGKARIILTLSEYSENFQGSISLRNIREEYPVNKDGTRKNIMGQAFYESHIRAIASIDAIEKAIKEGSTSKKIEDKEW
jgi:hypothetical protein